MDLAATLRCDDRLRGNVAIAVNEAATNLVKHAKEGELHIQQCEQNGATGIELLAVDRGPGIKSVDAALEDGNSTTRMAGTGLGAIRRLSSEFDIHSLPEKGTVIVARFYPDTGRRASGTSSLI